MPAFLTIAFDRQAQRNKSWSIRCTSVSVSNHTTERRSKNGLNVKTSLAWSSDCIVGKTFQRVSCTSRQTPYSVHRVDSRHGKFSVLTGDLPWSPTCRFTLGEWDNSVVQQRIYRKTDSTIETQNRWNTTRKIEHYQIPLPLHTVVEELVASSCQWCSASAAEVIGPGVSMQGGVLILEIDLGDTKATFWWTAMKWWSCGEQRRKERRRNMHLFWSLIAGIASAFDER